MFRIFRGSVVLFAVALLTACASPAEVQNMVVTKSSVATVLSTSPFAAAIAIKSVNGGEDTNPLWISEVSNAGFREALRGSMAQTGLLSSETSNAKFDLNATLAKIDQPLFGLDLTVTSHVRYRLTERSTVKDWFDEEISVAHTATFSDAAFAVQRLRFANEGSIRENIKKFLEELSRRKSALY